MQATTIGKLQLLTYSIYEIILKISPTGGVWGLSETIYPSAVGLVT